MKLHIESTCGPHETHEVPESMVREFENEYRNGTDAVLSVPDGDPEMTHFITRTALLGSSSGPDDVEEPEDPEGDEEEEGFLPEEGDAEGVPATEETATT